MSEPPIHYTKLPGPGAGWVGRTRLWLADDHVLEVNSTIFTERYHRYFLRDIRTVLAHRTKTGFYWNVAFASLAALALAIAGAVFWLGEKIRNSGRITPGDLVGIQVVAGMFAAVALFVIVILLVNVFLGPTCRFYIETTAGRHLIAAPTRLRRADRLLEKLVPHIESAQSIAAPEPTALS